MSSFLNKKTPKCPPFEENKSVHLNDSEDEYEE